MIEGGPLDGGCTSAAKTNFSSQYDYLKQVSRIARNNGWDVKCLSLASQDLPNNPTEGLSQAELRRRNALVKNILKRFGAMLTPPVPSDLEASIRNKKVDMWLPWEKEAIEKVDSWRTKIYRIKPEILTELHNVEVADNQS